MLCICFFVLDPCHDRPLDDDAVLCFDVCAWCVVVFLSCAFCSQVRPEELKDMDIMRKKCPLEVRVELLFQLVRCSVDLTIHRYSVPAYSRGPDTNDAQKQAAIRVAVLPLRSTSPFSQLGWGGTEMRVHDHALLLCCVGCSAL